MCTENPAHWSYRPLWHILFLAHTCTHSYPRSHVRYHFRTGKHADLPASSCIKGHLRRRSTSLALLPSSVLSPPHPSTCLCPRHFTLYLPLSRSSWSSHLTGVIRCPVDSPCTISLKNLLWSSWIRLNALGLCI